MPHKRTDLSGSFLPCASGTHTKARARSAEYTSAEENWPQPECTADKGAHAHGGGWLTLEWPFGVSCSYARQPRTARSLRAARLEPRDTNVTERVENDEEGTADSEARVQ